MFSRFFLAFVLIGFTRCAFANISVSPVSVYLSQSSRSGEIVVRNTSDSPLLIRLDMKFGYPVADSIGNVTVFMSQDSGFIEKSCVRWMYLYPRRFMLYPKQSRTVRIIARPPSALQDGEYWGRIVIESETSSSLDTLARRKAVSAALEFNFNIIIPIFYRKGTVAPDVSLMKTTFAQTDKNIIFYIDSQPTTQAAYLGNIVCQILNNAGDVVQERTTTVGVYVPLRKRFEFDRASLPPGDYKLRILYNTDRPEEGGFAIHAEPKSYVKDFTIR